MFQLDRTLEDRQLWADSIVQNSAKMTSISEVTQTYGWASFTIVLPDFGVVFAEPPIVSYAAVLDDLHDQTSLVTTTSPDSVPRCTGGVLRWHTNKRGLWIGATVFACVDQGAQPYLITMAPYLMNHHFTFSAIAMKMVPAPDFTDQ